MTDDYQPRDVIEDTDDEDAVPVEEDQVPDVREDPVEDDASTSPQPTTEGDQ